MVDNVTKAKDARDKMGEIFESEVKDDHFDNGLLEDISKIAQLLEGLVQKLQGRTE